MSVNILYTEGVDSGIHCHFNIYHFEWFIKLLIIIIILRKLNDLKDHVKVEEYRVTCLLTGMCRKASNTFQYACTLLT